MFSGLKEFLKGVLQQHFGHISLKVLGSKNKMDLIILLILSLPLFLEIWVCTFGFLNLWHVNSPFCWTHHRCLIIPGSTCCLFVEARPKGSSLTWDTWQLPPSRNKTAIPNQGVSFFLGHQDFTIFQPCQNTAVTKIHENFFQKTPKKSKGPILE